MLRKFLICLIAPLALVAFAAAPALATEVTPAKTEFKAKLVTGTKSEFRLENGTGATVTCEASTTSGTTPSSTEPVSGPPFYNNNPPSTTNTSEKAGGSVLANLVKPTFTTCTSPASATTVTTNETNGKWSIDWNVLNDAAAEWTTAAIGVPKAGAVIKLEASSKVCELTVDPETAQGVVGYWENGTTTTESKLYINEQVFYAPTASTKANCETIIGSGVVADSPAVFRSSYTIEDAAGAGIIERW